MPYPAGLHSSVSSSLQTQMAPIHEAYEVVNFYRHRKKQVALCSLLTSFHNRELLKVTSLYNVKTGLLPHGLQNNGHNSTSFQYDVFQQTTDWHTGTPD